jgi:hypothetical protein
MSEKNLEKKKLKKKITPELITEVLTDRYHNGLTINEIKSKYGIGHELYKTINGYSDAFIEKFGSKKKNISVEQLEHYWNNMSLKETKPTVEEKFEANIEKNAA